MTQAAPLQTSNAKPKQSDSTRLLLQRKCVCGSNASVLTGECEQCGDKRIHGLQPKLGISEPGDRYEQEADRIADHVMRGPDGYVGPITPLMSSLQPKAVKPNRSSDDAESGSSNVQGKVETLRSSGGEPLQENVRVLMESRLNRDFSQVRVHSGPRATEVSRMLRAQAFTVGHDIVFGGGMLEPTSRTGQRLLAHELVHVAQQESVGSNVLQMKSLMTSRGRIPDLPGTIALGHMNEDEIEELIDVIEQLIEIEEVPEYQQDLADYQDELFNALSPVRPTRSTADVDFQPEGKAGLTTPQEKRRRVATIPTISEEVDKEIHSASGDLQLLAQSLVLRSLSDRGLEIVLSVFDRLPEQQRGEVAVGYAIALGQSANVSNILRRLMTTKRGKAILAEIQISADIAGEDVGSFGELALHAGKRQAESDAKARGVATAEAPSLSFTLPQRALSVSVIGVGEIELLRHATSLKVKRVGEKIVVSVAQRDRDVVGNAALVGGVEVDPDANVRIFVPEQRISIVVSASRLGKLVRGERIKALVEGATIASIGVPIPLGATARGIGYVLRPIVKAAVGLGKRAAGRIGEAAIAGALRTGVPVERLGTGVAGRSSSELVEGIAARQAPAVAESSAIGAVPKEVPEAVGAISETVEREGVEKVLSRRTPQAISELQSVIARGGSWVEISPVNRRLLGTLFGDVIERLSSRIFESVGRVVQNKVITQSLINDLRSQGGRILLVQCRLQIAGRTRRLDLAEIDFRNGSLEVIDVTSVERAEHVEKTKAYRDELQRLTGFAGDAMEMRYVGDDEVLFETLAEEVL